MAENKPKRTLATVLSVGLPLLAPVPTAWVAGTSLYNVLHFPVVVAIVAALVVELVGFGGVTTAQRMTEHNKHCKANEKAYRVPVWQAWAVIGIYLLAITALTVLVEFVAGAVKFAVLTFPLLGLSGFWLATLNSGIDRQERERTEKREKPKEETPKLTRRVAPQPKRNHVNRVQLVAELRRNPIPSDTELAQLFGVSRQAIGKARKKIAPAELGY